MTQIGTSLVKLAILFPAISIMLLQLPSEISSGLVCYTCSNESRIDECTKPIETHECKANEICGTTFNSEDNKLKNRDCIDKNVAEAKGYAHSCGTTMDIAGSNQVKVCGCQTSKCNNETTPNGTSKILGSSLTYPITGVIIIFSYIRQTRLSKQQN